MIRDGTHIYSCVCACVDIYPRYQWEITCVLTCFLFIQFLSFIHFIHIFSVSFSLAGLLWNVFYFFRNEWFTRSSGSPIVIHYSDFKELGNKQKWLYCIVVYHRVGQARLGQARLGWVGQVRLASQCGLDCVFLVESKCQHFLSDFIYFGSRPMCHFVAIMAWKVILRVEYLMKKYGCLPFSVLPKAKISVQESLHLLGLVSRKRSKTRAEHVFQGNLR